MPIKPENKARYPKDWKAIRERILARAGNRCEGSPAFPFCHIKNHAFRNNDTGEVTENLMVVETWTVVDQNSVSRIVLTIAHLNHIPEDVRDDNLRALCQRCHLNYDAKHHAQTAASTRKARKAIGDMFHDNETGRGAEVRPARNQDGGTDTGVSSQDENLFPENAPSRAI